MADGGPPLPPLPPPPLQPPPVVPAAQPDESQLVPLVEPVVSPVPPVCKSVIENWFKISSYTSFL